MIFLMKFIDFNTLKKGLPYLKRKFGVLAKPSMVITTNGKKFHIVWTSQIPVPLMMPVTVTSVINCTDGVEFNYSLFQYFNIKIKIFIIHYFSLFTKASPDETKYKTIIRKVSPRKIIQEDRDPISRTIKGIAVNEVNDDDQLIVVKSI